MKYAIFAGIAFVVAFVGLSAAPRPAINDYAVQVSIEGFARGSAVHLGDGLFLTAAHVVNVAEQPLLRREFYKSQRAEVLWSHKQYDIALMEAEDRGYFADMPAPRLRCDAAAIGAAVTITGYPGATMGNQFTTFGAIASPPLHGQGLWKEIQFVDAQIHGGQSGSGVIDGLRRLVGILVGGIGPRLPGPGGMVIDIGIAEMVPAPVLCKLMGRS